MKNKKIIALLLTMIMMLSTAVSYADTNIYTANWLALRKTPKALDFSYSDAWLQSKSTKYDNHLAIASMALTMAAGNTNDGNISQLLSDMGFSKITTNYATKVAKNENFCVAYAKKNVGKYTIVPVVVRGSYYTIEWVDNFHAGTSGDAKGYRSAANRIANYVKSYISKNGIAKNKVKLWVVGFSRGGAIADLVAESLTAKYGKARVYGYCFESPKTNKGNGKKANIHHVMNKYDGVPCVLPSYMGFGLAGKVSKTIGGGSEDSMKAVLKRITTEEVYNIYKSPQDFCWAKIDTSYPALMGLAQGKLTINKTADGDQQEFWNLVIKRCKKVVPSRKKYTSIYSSKTKYAAKKLGVKAMTVEQSFMGIMEWYQGLSDVEKSTVQSKLGGAISDLNDTIGIFDMLNLCDNNPSNFNLTNDQYTTAVKTVSDALGGNKKLTGAIAGGLALAMDMLDVDLASDKQILGTVLYSDANGANAVRLVVPHGPEVSMAWLMAADLVL